MATSKLTVVISSNKAIVFDNHQKQVAVYAVTKQGCEVFLDGNYAGSAATPAEFDRVVEQYIAKAA